MAFFSVVGVLHLLGWGTYLHYSGIFPSLGGLGSVAYLLGLRHAFDADHIAAVDDTTRYLIQAKERPLGVGFFFALGHSTVVLVLSVALGLGATIIQSRWPALQNIGSLISALICGTFLWIIGILNLFLLLNMLNVWRGVVNGHHDHGAIEKLLRQRGLLNRLFGGRLQKFMQHSWQMYPLGILFGLGFDTASEVGFLGVTAGASVRHLPLAAIVSLPVLFAAGMTLMDTTDGVLMCKAYDWAFLNPLRKVFYNLVITGLSVVVALAIGTIELLQVFITRFSWRGAAFEVVAKMDFGILGYGIVGLFLLAWGTSMAWWAWSGLEGRSRRRALPGGGNPFRESTQNEV